MVMLEAQAELVARKRYYLKDDDNNPVENSDDMFKRVAAAVGDVETRYGKLNVEANLLANDFHSIMSSLDFVPNSPTLMNAGTEQGTLSACFVLPLEDSMEGIMTVSYTHLTLPTNREV